MAVNDTPRRPLHGWRGLLIFDREELTGESTHPIGRAAESVGPTRRCGLRSYRYGDDRFAHHDERSPHKTGSAFVLSARATPAAARNEERGRLANPTGQVREAALLPQRHEDTGGR